MENSDNFGPWNTEWALWHAIRTGDEAAFTFLFEKYHGHLYNYGYKLTADVGMVEDAIQDVYIDIWRLRSSLAEQVLSIRYYLLRCLRRRIMRRIGPDAAAIDLDALPDLVLFTHDFLTSDSEACWIEAESTEERQKWVKNLISDLPHRQLEAITLRYFEGLSHAQIAQMMGVSQKSVRNFLYKALTSMRSMHLSPLCMLIPSLISLVL